MDGHILDSSRGLGMTVNGESFGGRRDELRFVSYPPLDPSTELRMSGPSRATRKVCVCGEGMDSGSGAGMTERNGGWEEGEGLDDGEVSACFGEDFAAGVGD